MKKKIKTIKIQKVIPKLILVLLGLMFAYPFLWMLLMSFKGVSEFYVNPFGLPEAWDFANFAEALQVQPLFKYMFNSLIYTVVSAFLTVIVGGMLAYAVSRMNWKYANAVLMYITLGLVIPAQVVMIPLYGMIDSMGLKETRLALILPYVAFEMASCVLMLNAFFRGLPKELEEAACIDGCNVYQSFLHIMFPVMKPALATQMVLISIHVWNEFPLALVLGAKEKLKPLTIGLLDFFVTVGTADWGVIGAAMLISTVPIMVVYALGNRQIENALSVGALK